MSVRASLGQLLVRNWPIKLAAGFFAAMLYVAVAAQQPLAQTFAMRLAVGIPPGRTVRQQPGGVTVVITGKGSEILQLRSFPLGIVRIVPKEVRMAGEVTAIVERSLAGVPITTAASGFTGFLLSVERVAVTVRGPESKVNTLTRDSVRVVAHLVGKAGPGGYARLPVSAPPRVVGP